MIACFVLAALELWLVQGQHLSARAGAHQADQLFVDSAQSLLGGAWEGGSLYSLWIAAMFVAGIPLLLSQHLLYIGACALLARALAPLLRSPGLAALLFAILLFSPASYDAEATARVLPAGVEPALVVLIAACAAALFVRRRRSWRALAPWAAGLGLALAAFWLAHLAQVGSSTGLETRSEVARDVGRREGAWPLLAALGRAGASLASFEGFEARPTPSSGPASALRQFELLTHERLAPAEEIGPLHLEGWAFAGREPIEFVVRHRDGSRAESRIRFAASPAVYQQLLSRGRDLPAARRARFSLWTSCQHSCSVELRAAGRLLESFRFDRLPEPIDRDDLFLFLLPLDSRVPLPDVSAIDRFRLATLARLGSLYGVLTPWATVLALIAFLLEAVLLRRAGGDSGGWFVAASLLTGILALTTALVLTDPTSSGGLAPARYAGASALVPAFVLVALWQTASRLAGSPRG